MQAVSPLMLQQQLTELKLSQKESERRVMFKSFMKILYTKELKFTQLVVVGRELGISV